MDSVGLKKDTKNKGKGKNNQSLHNAKRSKNDEFYTSFNTIAEEVDHYREQLQGKRILCNCDYDATLGTGYKELYNETDGILIEDSDFGNGLTCNFAKYFIGKIKLDIKNGTHDWNIKSLTASGINPLNEKGTRFQDIDYNKYDIVITNPPFSLFGEFLSLMQVHNMQFLIIGNKNAIIRKDVFPLIKDNRVWLGYSQPKDFITPDGQPTNKVNGLCRWFTNLNVEKRNQRLMLLDDFDLKDYPKYDNYDAIEVSKVRMIPDYDGLIGVPITFIDKFNPDQFEILGLFARFNEKDLQDFQIVGKKVHNNSEKPLWNGPIINGNAKYSRIIIRKRV